MNDDELKRLKEWCEYECFLSTDIKDIRKLLPGLLARLEAAEKALNEIRGMHGRESIEVWLRACGKEVKQ